MCFNDSYEMQNYCVIEHYEINVNLIFVRSWKIKLFLTVDRLGMKEKKSLGFYFKAVKIVFLLLF